MKANESSHSETLLACLDKFRQDNLYCDVSLIIDTHTIYAHSIVLAACSPFFHNVLKAQILGPMTQIQLTNIHIRTAESMVKFMYTSVAGLVNVENVWEILPTVHIFGIQPMINECKSVLQTLVRTDRCMEVWKLSRYYHLLSVTQQCQHFLRREFPEGFHQPYFLSMTIDDAASVISDCPINSQQKFTAMKLWLEHSVYTRLDFIPLLQEKFPYLTDPLEQLKVEYVAKEKGICQTSLCNDDSNSAEMTDWIDTSALHAGIDTALPAGIDTALPAGIDTSALPAGIDTSALPAGIDTSALPAGIDTSALPAGIDTSALPAGIDTSALPAGIYSATKLVGVNPTVKRAVKDISEEPPIKYSTEKSTLIVSTAKSFGVEFSALQPNGTDSNSVLIENESKSMPDRLASENLLRNIIPACKNITQPIPDDTSEDLKATKTTLGQIDEQSSSVSLIPSSVSSEANIHSTSAKYENENRRKGRTKMNKSKTSKGVESESKRSSSAPDNRKQSTRLRTRCVVNTTARIADSESDEKAADVTATTNMKTQGARHSSDKEQECHVCMKFFKSISGLKMHMQLHNRKKVFKCDECSMICSTEANLRFHKEANHVDVQLHCKKCNSTFKKHIYWKRHMKRHSQERTAACSICGKCYLPCYLADHMRNHAEKRIICEICGKHFIKPSYLEKHMVIHRAETERTSFTCDICNKTFFYNSGYKRHMVTHQGHKDYVCEICGKDFYSKQGLKLHFLSHSQERPFKCALCDKSFKTSSQCSYHRRFHPGQDWRRSGNSQLQYCIVCGKGFPSKSQMNKHALCHSTVKNIVCDVCGKAFTRPDYLIRHTKKFHSESNEIKLQTVPFQKTQENFVTVDGKTFSYQLVVH